MQIDIMSILVQAEMTKRLGKRLFFFNTCGQQHQRLNILEASLNLCSAVRIALWLAPN